MSRKQRLLENAAFLRDVVGTGAAARYLRRFGIPFEDARYLLARKS